MFASEPDEFAAFVPDELAATGALPAWLAADPLLPLGVDGLEPPAEAAGAGAAGAPDAGPTENAAEKIFGAVKSFWSCPM